MAKSKTKKKPSLTEAKKVINKAADKRDQERHKASKKEIELALDGREKLVLQKRNKDTIVYVRMKPDMWLVFEEAYAAHCRQNMLNPSSYGMSSFVRENAFANLRSIGAV